MGHTDDKKSKKNQTKKFDIKNYKGYILTLILLFAILFVLINQAFLTTGKQTSNIMPKLIRDLLRYIDANLSEPITLKTLEHEFYLNGTYIRRQFKKHTGLTLRNYLLERRISHARTLLDSDLSITEVCHRSGFSDYANFIRSFTKTVGISPGKYAKQQKN